MGSTIATETQSHTGYLFLTDYQQNCRSKDALVNQVDSYLGWKDKFNLEYKW